MSHIYPHPVSHGLVHFCSMRSLVAIFLLSLTFSLVHAGEFSNFHGMKFIDIPAGAFQMGSCKGALDNESENKKPADACTGNDLDASVNETPLHRVNVAGFQMSQTEVTLGQFRRYIIAADRSDLVTDEFMNYNPHGDEAPVVQVSWNDAKNFIEWLNKSKPATDRGTYRLPSEAEWEYACRAGGNHPYCGSLIESTVAWHEGNSGRHQQAVGKKAANSFGLYDMSGNVWEWVEDCYHGNYREAAANSSAWISNCTTPPTRVLRGGSWKGDAPHVRAAIRNNATSVSRSNFIGFRLARSIP